MDQNPLFRELHDLDATVPRMVVSSVSPLWAADVVNAVSDLTVPACYVAVFEGLWHSALMLREAERWREAHSVRPLKRLAAPLTPER